MPCCSAPSCIVGNRGWKKVFYKDEANLGLKKPVLYRFPENRLLQDEWIRQIGKDPDGWRPTKHSVVCSLHFADSAFVRMTTKDRKGRKRKNLLRLAHNAVPTLFYANKRKMHVQISVPDTKTEIKAEHNYMRIDDNVPKDELSKPKPVRFEVASDLNLKVQEAMMIKVKGTMVYQSYADDRNGKVSEESEKDKEIKSLKATVQRQEKLIADLRSNLAGFQKIFTTDQVKFLKKGAVNEWSDETASDGLRIKYACGEYGYNYLRNKGYPLPALKNLDMKMSNRKIPVKVLSECSQLMKDKGEFENCASGVPFDNVEHSGNEIVEVQEFDIEELL